MAGMDYTCADSGAKVVSCSVAGCNGKHKAKGLCQKHYRQSQRKGIDQYNRRINCAHCGIEFESTNSKSMYCSNKCKQAAWKALNAEKLDAQKIEKQESRLKYSPVAFNKCRTCNKLFVSKRKKSYCSEKCQPSNAHSSRIKPSSICKHCGNEFVQSSTSGRPSEYCSQECKDSSNAIKTRIYRAARRKVIGSDSNRKRAKRYGCKYEPVVTKKVLERDGYRCKLCGIKTPKRKRGSYDDDAPELDHIIPLSKGGEHSYRNTQCVCRKCNIQKSDKPLGQLLMF